MDLQKEMDRVFPQIEPLKASELHGKVLEMIYVEVDDGSWMLTGHDKKESKVYCLLSGGPSK